MEDQRWDKGLTPDPSPRGEGSEMHSLLEEISRALLKAKKRPFLYSKSSTEMVFLNELFQTVRLSKWYLHFDTSSSIPLMKIATRYARYHECIDESAKASPMLYAKPPSLLGRVGVGYLTSLVYVLPNLPQKSQVLRPST